MKRSSTKILAICCFLLWAKAINSEQPISEGLELKDLVDIVKVDENRIEETTVIIEKTESIGVTETPEVDNLNDSVTVTNNDDDDGLTIEVVEEVIYSGDGVDKVFEDTTDVLTADEVKEILDLTESTYIEGKEEEELVVGDAAKDSYCRCDCNTGIILEEITTSRIPTQDIESNTKKENLETVDNTSENLNEVESSNTTVETVDIEETTKEPIANDAESTTANEESVNTISPSVEASTEKPPSSVATPLTPCTALGDFPHESNCRAYYSCVQSDAMALLERNERSCPSRSAFNVALARCTRDIAACIDVGPSCDTAGSFADPLNNASYYWCVPQLSGVGMHKYHIECRVGKVFVPQLGKCYLDINNLDKLPPNYGLDNGLPDDEDIVEAELKLFKATEKAKLKAQKLKDKYEMKLQKELAKKAAKEAKEKEKAALSQESENFICTQLGNFASSLRQDRYFTCVSKKDKFKVMAMSCPVGHVFQAVEGVCVLLNEGILNTENVD